MPITPPSNRVQKLGYALATVVLASLVTIFISIYFYEPKVLKLALGRQDPRQLAFAEKLADLVQRNSRNLRISLLQQADETAVAASLASGNADMAISRSENRAPSVARDLADLETDIVFIVSPKAQKLAGLSGLRGKRVAIWSQQPSDEALIRRILAEADVAPQTIQAIAQDVPLERLFAGPTYQAVIALPGLSRLTALSGTESFGRRIQGYDILGVDVGKALERRIPGLYSETIEAGMIATSPKWPESSMDTVVVKHQLLVRSKLPSTNVSDLARIIFENKEELSTQRDYATHIETPDTDKDALIVAHPGVAAYLDDDVKTFLDRYSDLFYIGTTVAGIIGSAFLGLYSWFTKVTPISAGLTAPEISDIAGRIREATSLQDLNLMDVELEDLLKQTLLGLHQGIISSDGLDIFRLAYDNAHRTLTQQRSALMNAPVLGMASAPNPPVTPTIT